MCKQDTKPFIGDHDGEEDGAGEDDVVDGEEELGEDDGIELTIIREGPLER